VAIALERADRLLYHNEPIWRNGELVGRISSGMFGHTLGAALGLGYVSNSGAPVSLEWIAAGQYEVEVAAERVPARVSLRPFYDPASARVKC
jgi:glycine cleavage system aminomethyltransferase T